MRRNEQLLARFMSCEHVNDAQDITESCLNTQAFAALTSTSGAFLKISKSVKSVLGCDESRLMRDKETIFSMAPKSEKSELFKAYSNALTTGSTYRVLQHMTCSNSKALPVVSHYKKVFGDHDEEMVLCLNIRA